MKRDCSVKWIIITGGVVSGLGKGIVTSSLGALLKTQGLRVGAVKIDPYINIDAGTMRPTVHGEVFVTFDGGETDQDLGNYERFLDVKLPKSSNITTGQVYQEVIRRERNLEYEGSDVEVTKHIPLEIQRRLRQSAEESGAEYMVVEIGGTVGDYQNIIFLEAVRQMKMKGEDVMFVHVSYLPILGSVGEMKTKPTQHSVRALNSVGINADLIVGRALMPIDAPRREKISYFCNVAPDRVISAPDVPSIYQVPARFLEQDVGRIVLEHFGGVWKDNDEVKKWRDFSCSFIADKPVLNVGIVGKYFDIGEFTLEDSYISVIEAIKSAASNQGLCAKIVWIDAKEFETHPEHINRLGEVDAVVVPGGFGGSGVEGKIRAIQYCREQGVPFLGLCYGLQLAVIEWARNHMGLKDAHTTEVDPSTPDPVVMVLPAQVELLAKKQYGNTMRLGDYPAQLTPKSKVATLYGDTTVVERHRHRYEVNPEYVSVLEKDGLVFCGKSPDGLLVEFLERTDHPFFVATQAHPEFSSRPFAPNPLFLGLVKAAMGRQKKE